MKYEGQHVSSSPQIKSIDIDCSKNNSEQDHLIHSLQNFYIDKFENISQDISIENRALYINLQTNSIERPIKMLIDTGASVSIISSKLVSPKTELQNIRCRLFGLGSSNDGFITKGLLHTNTIISDISLGLSLHVVDQKYLGSIDGILGFDFMMNYKTNIDIENLKLHFKLSDLYSKKSEKPDEKYENSTTDKIKNNEDFMKYFENMLKYYEYDEINQPTTFDNLVEITSKRIANDIFLSDAIDNESNNLILNTNEQHRNNEYYDYMEAMYFHKIEYEQFQSTKIKTIQNELKSIEKLPEINTFHFSLSNYTRLKNEQNMNRDIESDSESRFSAQLYPCSSGIGRINHFNNGNNNEMKNMDDRSKFIFEKLKFAHCEKSEIEFIRGICGDFPYQFYVEGDNLGHTTVIKHTIKIIPGSKIVNVKQYRIPHKHREILSGIIKDYEKQGIIEKCQSNYNSPALLVPKKDDNNDKTDYRFVIDYKKLNEICPISNFPIPFIDDILDGLGGCKYFTTLDIKGAFHQIILDETSRDYTAFTVGHFQYRWIRMPMGLSEAPLTWQRAINTILINIIGKGVYIYLDDVIVYGKTIDEHNKTLCMVMTLLKKHNLQLKISKCNFFAKNFEYLGFVVSESGISANPRKIEIIQNFPVPKNAKEVQSFLGILNYYRRFVNNFARIAKPLTMLCKQDLPFIWTENTQKAFDVLKKALIGDVVLQFPDFGEIFYVTTDASDVAIGAVLSQGELPNDRPIHFFSRTLNDCQRRYSTIQRELLAIVEAVKAFRVYLYGRFFILITDHKPLCYLFNMKDCGSRLFRQRLDLMEYNFKILHRAGKQNAVADALSRIKPISIEEALEIENKKSQVNALTRAQAKRDLSNSNQNGLTLDERDGTILNRRGFDIIFHLIPIENDYLKNRIVNKFGISNFSKQWNSFNNIHFAKTISNQFSHANNVSDTNQTVLEIFDICKRKHAESIAINIDFDSIRHFFHLKNIFNNIFKNSNISITLFLNKIVEIVEKSDIEIILDLYHKSLLGGHFGVDKMLKTISKFYKWNGMTQDIKNYVSKCEICQKTKVTTNTKVPMQISSLGEILFDHTYIDFVGPISPPSVDGHKYIFTATCDLTKYMVAVPTKDCSAITTADCLLKHILLKYNFPSRLISDNASNFNSKVIQELSKTLQIKKIFTTPYHPQSNIVERNHRTLNSYMRAFSSKNRENWHLLLIYAMFAYNNAIHISTGYTPHELAHGFRIQIPNHLTRPKITYNYDNLADMVRNNIAGALELAKTHLYNQKTANKQSYDKNARSLDVRVGDQVFIKSQHKTDKFQPIYEGPFEVTEAYDEYVEIKKNGKRYKVHKNLIKKANANSPFPNVDLNDINFTSFFQSD